MADHPPIAMRPGVFDVDDVLPELAAARKIHGPDYGRAIMHHQREQKKARKATKATPIPRKYKLDRLASQIAAANRRELAKFFVNK
jgi:hypothetical protein